MVVLHLLTSGGIGGIEVLCRDIGLYSNNSEHVFAFLFGEGLLYESMKQNGLHVVSCRKPRKISYARLHDLIKLAKDCDVIIVHHNDPFLEMYYLALHSFLPKKKYISMIHHCYDPQEERAEYGFAKRNIKKIIIKQMLKKSDRLLFVSKAGLDSFLRCFRFNRNKAEVVYNGINIEKLEEGKKCKKNDGKIPVLMYAGRLEKIKGVDQLVNAIALLSDLKCKIQIIGDGKQKNDLLALSQELNLAERIEFINFQIDLTPWLTKADIFIYPSRMEIFGLSVVEALAYQCICVVNNVGGLPEIIENHKNGLLNMDNSVEGLAKTIEQAVEIFGNPEEKDKIRKQALITAERFCIQNTINQLEKNLEDC